MPQVTVEQSVQIAIGHYRRGAALQKNHQMAEAFAAYQQALAIHPHFAEAACQIGAFLLERDEPEAAIEYLHRAIADRADFAKALNNLGGALFNVARFDESVANLHQALLVRPDYPQAQWNLAMALLIGGDFERGWKAFRSGWAYQARQAPTQIPGPEWDGSELAGKRILIHNLWGLGDAMQMVRFLPRVAERGGQIICFFHESLHRLLRQFTEVSQWIGLDEKLPAYDVQCPLMCLPAILGASAETIGMPSPYLRADEADIARWRERMPSDGRLKVGLVWGNKPNPVNRCPRPEELSALAKLENVWFCSLQKPVGETKRQPEIPAGLTLTDWTSELNDLADTAGLIANLDLIVAVDTAVAHLAGAMGKRVWMMIQHVPDWRWLMNRPDTAWYPTMRLFRQRSRGDWGEPIGQIVRDLAEPSHISSWL